MAGDDGVNVAPEASHLQAVTLAIGQLAVTLAFVGVTVLLLGTGKPVDGQLWTLDVALVAFYMGQRVNVVRP